MLPLVSLGDGVLIVIDVGAWAAIHAGTGYLAHRLDDDFCRRDTWLTRIRAIERSGALWKAVRVHRWKDHVPEAGAFFPGGVSKRHLSARTDGGLSDFAALTRRAEIGHWAAAAGSLLFVLWNPLPIAIVMVVYGVAVNAPFIAIQRYNRLRVSRLLDRRASRRSASARSRADTTGSNMPYGSPPIE